MVTYFLCLLSLSSLATGHSLASRYYTGEWFYKYTTPLFAMFSVICIVVLEKM